MPHKNTFSIKPIGKIVRRYIHGVSVDPFANSNRLASVTNDLDPAMGCDYCMDALGFLKMWNDDEIDTVLFDPPYSPRQVSECYKRFGKTVNMQTTQSSFWSAMKREIARIVKVDGIVITCGWNSGGVGKSHGFEMMEIMLVAHGGWHNDTIVTVERKSNKDKQGSFL